MIKPNTNIERLFELTAHEWLHQYLIFYPLGRSIFKNTKMTEINETLANIFGKEISKNICSNKLYKSYCENNDQITIDYMNFILGIAISSFVAFLTIRWFLELVARIGMLPFVIYRMLLGLIIILII